MPAAASLRQLHETSKQHVDHFREYDGKLAVLRVFASSLSRLSALALKSISVS